MGRQGFLYESCFTLLFDKVERVEVKDIRLPQQLTRAMAAEAEAARLKSPGKKILTKINLVVKRVPKSWPRRVNRRHEIW